MAQQQLAPEKYLLNELSATERTAFEEHFFDCPICAEQVRQDFTVVENLKEVLREQKAPRAETSRGFLSWLRPASLIPSLAALALAAIVVYQNVIPNAGSIPEAQFVPAASMVAPAARGRETHVTLDHRKSSFLLSFSVDGAKPDSFVCDFERQDGRAVTSVSVPPQQIAGFTLNLLLPAKLFPPGSYRMLLHPASDPANSTAYAFAIEASK